jgi:type I restriction enzyme S subunit
MSWRSVTLGGLIDIKHGFAFKGQYFTDSGKYVLLTPGNCHERGGLKLKGEKEKYYVGEVPENYLLSKGDLLVVMTDLVNSAPILGGSFFIPKDDKYLHNQRLGLVQNIDETRIHKKFLYYLLNTNDYRGQVRGSASGATVRHTSPDRIKRCKVYIPDAIREQDRIASILSAYDDLIENNRRRIQLLEQAARLLYKEWFVHLRFPGHKHVKINDGVPDGWEKVPLGDVIEIKKGKNITRDFAKEGDVPVVAGGLNPAYFHNIANVVGPVITVSASGANAGFINLYHEDIWASDCSYIGADVTDHIHYFYLLLISRQIEISTFQKGAAQPHVYPKDLMRLSVLCPPWNFANLFEQEVSKNFLLIRNLIKQNKLLAKARDLLLPRLMNGEPVV